MKKKWIALIALAAALLLVLAFCGLNREDEMAEPVTEPSETTVTEPTETTDPTDPPAPVEPEWEAGVIRTAYAGGIFDVLEKGMEVNVVGQFEEFYVIAGEEYDLLVEKQFIRMNSEDVFEGWRAYARSGAEVFASVYMREEPIATLAINTELTVLEGKGDWLYVQWDDGEGYVLEEKTSKTRISSGSTSGNSGGSASGGSGGSTEQPKDGTDVDINLLSGSQVQGGVVLLGTYYGPQQEADFEPGAGVVIADKVEAYLTLVQQGDEVKVTEYDEEYCTVWVEDALYVRIPRWRVRLEGDGEYETWNGYSSNGAVVYAEYQLRNEVKKLNRNTEIVVLDEIPARLYSYYHPGCYVVLIDGGAYYMLMDSVSDTKYSAPSGGSSSGGSSAPADVWTPPAL